MWSGDADANRIPVLTARMKSTASVTVTDDWMSWPLPGIGRSISVLPPIASSKVKGTPLWSTPWG